VIFNPYTYVTNDMEGFHKSTVYYLMMSTKEIRYFCTWYRQTCFSDHLY